MRLKTLLIIGTLLTLLPTVQATAPEGSVTLHYELVTEQFAPPADWWQEQTQHFYHGRRVASELAERLPTDHEVRTIWQLDADKFAAYIGGEIVPQVERAATPAELQMADDGGISFIGAAQFGRQLPVTATRKLIEYALQNSIADVYLPVREVAPIVTVDDELQAAGVDALLAVGSSTFYGSSSKRVFNVNRGAAIFNGLRIPRGATVSFNEELGPVTNTSGYAEEYVILGNRVEKQAGGGICQVSSTFFRAGLLAGLPMAERYPHSFAVKYYQPYGLDATIWQDRNGGKDVKFTNDTDGDIVVQTVLDADNYALAFHFYGTRDARRVELVGPFLSNSRPVREPTEQVNAELASGERKQVSWPVRGMDAQWFRLIDGSAEPITSRYQSRGAIIEVGPEPEPVIEDDGNLAAVGEF